MLLSGPRFSTGVPRAQRLRARLNYALQHAALEAGMLLHRFHQLGDEVVTAFELHPHVAPGRGDAGAVAYEQVVEGDGPALSAGRSGREG